MSGSSFQKKSPLEFEDIFANVSALYCILKSDSNPAVLKRAELRQGQVAAEAVDFIADYEMRVKHTLTPEQYRRVLRSVVEGKYENVPQSIRQDLGKLFYQSDLSYDGAYKVLFWKAKNMRLHDTIETERPSFPEETINPEELLNG